MQKVVLFNKAGYDPFIDFIKAYAIICVLIGHTFPSLDKIGYAFWAGMQVPLFILVQSFHTLKKKSPQLSFKKIFWRVLAPFILVETILFVFLPFIYPGAYNYRDLFHEYLEGFGIGPGSYYPWIYIQIAVLLPIAKWLIKRLTNYQLLLLFLLVCEGTEIVSSLIHVSDDVYRLLAYRYFFLIYLGWVWVNKGIRINVYTIFMSLLSFLTIFYFLYISNNDEPFFFNTSWNCHRWPCYYFVAIGGTYLLFLLYNLFCKQKRALNTIKVLAKCSYEIFLIQMVLCVICPYFNFIPIEFLRVILRIIIIFGLSIFGGFYFNKWYGKLMEKYI